MLTTHKYEKRTPVYVPNVIPTYPDTHFWINSQIKPSYINIKASDLKRDSIGDLNSIFPFPVILDYIMKDKKDESLYPPDIINDFFLFQPALITNSDVPIYTDDSPLESQKKFEYFKEELSCLRVYIPLEKVIVLLPGRNKEENSACINFALSLGYTKFGIACADLLEREQNAIARVRTMLDLLKLYTNDIFLFGISSLSYFELFSDVRYIISKGWHHKWKFKKKYSSNKCIKINVPKFDILQKVFDDGKLKAMDQSDKSTFRNIRRKVFCRNLIICMNKFDELKTQKTLGGKSCQKEEASQELIFPESPMATKYTH